MIKAFTVISAMLFLVIVSSCERNTRCDLLTYTYRFPPSTEDTGYMKMYISQEDFSSGQHPISATTANGLMSFELTGDNQQISFIDIRRADGTNSWSDQAALFQLGISDVHYTSCLTEINYNDQTALYNAINSSATYLHLVLDHEMQDGGNKTWEISEIYDENRVDVSDRPEWICIKNLVFTFFKGGKGAIVRMAVAEGGRSCGVFQELFGDRAEAFATYSLEGDMQDELRITAPAVSDALKAQLTFHIVDSGYDEIEISLTNDSSQLGYALLTPVIYE